MSNELQNLINLAKPILSQYGVTESYVFGSYARGENRVDSDIDILLSTFPERMSLYDLIDLKESLQNVLHKEVDLVTERSIRNEKLKSYIQQTLIPITIN
jgi:predicted nucleotidyltransferase